MGLSACANMRFPQVAMFVSVWDSSEVPTALQRRVVSLIRVSSADQAKDGKSGLDRQRSDIRFTCQLQGLVVVREFELIDIIGPAVRRTAEFRELKRWV